MGDYSIKRGPRDDTMTRREKKKRGKCGQQNHKYIIQLLKI